MIEQGIRLYIADRKPVLFRDAWCQGAGERPWGYAGMMCVEDRAVSEIAAQLRALETDQDRRQTASAWLDWGIRRLNDNSGQVRFVSLGAVLDLLDGRLEACHRAAWGTMLASVGVLPEHEITAIVHEADLHEEHAPWTGQPVLAVEYADETDDAVCLRLADLLLGVTENAFHWSYRDDDREALALKFLPSIERAMRESADERGGCSVLFYPRVATSSLALAGDCLPDEVVWRSFDPAIRVLVEPTLFDF